MFQAVCLLWQVLTGHFSESVSSMTSENYKGGRWQRKSLIEVLNSSLILEASVHENETKQRELWVFVKGYEYGTFCFKIEVSEPLVELQKQIEKFLLKHSTIDGILLLMTLWLLKL